MTTLTPSERARISRAYLVTVPADTRVQIIPRGVSGVTDPGHWKDGRSTAFRMMIRASRCKAAAARAENNAAPLGQMEVM